MKYGITSLFILVTFNGIAAACDPNCYLDPNVVNNTTSLQACLQSLPCPTTSTTAVTSDPNFQQYQTAVQNAATKPWDDQIAQVAAWYNALPAYEQAYVASDPSYLALLSYLQQGRQQALDQANQQLAWEAARRSYVAQRQSAYQALVAYLLGYTNSTSFDPFYSSTGSFSFGPFGFN